MEYAFFKLQNIQRYTPKPLAISRILFIFAENNMQLWRML